MRVKFDRAFGDSLKYLDGEINDSLIRRLNEPGSEGALRVMAPLSISIVAAIRPPTECYRSAITPRGGR